MGNKLLSIITLLILFEACCLGQTISSQNSYKYQGSLSEFAQFKYQEWRKDKHVADSIFNKLNLAVRQTDRNSNILELQKFYHGQPLFYSTQNLYSGQTIGVNNAWQISINQNNITGNGISGLIWDGGQVNQNHQEFLNGSYSRVLQRDDPVSISDHSTHISGTIAAQGINPLATGMAPQGQIFAYDFNNDLAEIASEAADGSMLSNHSYGAICGWRYDLNNEIWYWHGDYTVSNVEDIKFGFYDELSRDLDFIIYNAPKYVLVKSAGNDHDDGPVTQPVEHLIWDENWITSTDYHELDGGTNGFDCMSSMAVAKNVITVGSVKDIAGGYTNEASVILEDYSSWGPTDDGRIKPDIVANGDEVYSTTAESNSSYTSFNGTSMAAASITGSVMLIKHAQELLQPGVTLNSSTIKGLLIHTADESGDSPGPDYKYGWGLANIYKAIDLLVANAGNGGQNLIEESLLADSEYKTTVNVLPGIEFLKATICWTDPPANPPDYNLNPQDLMLINDLDLTIKNLTNDEISYPWILDPQNPNNEAGTGNNFRDNVEQILIKVPDAGQYEISVNHKGTLINSTQAFSLLISGNESPAGFLPPNNLFYSTGNTVVRLWFNPASADNLTGYNIYRNNQLLTSITDTFYLDTQVENDIEYTYFITSVYQNGLESLPTNTIYAKPQLPLTLPYMANFEEPDHHWILKNDISGWRQGNSDSLNSYYLNYSSNSGQFLGVDSYTAGKGIHTWDYATSPSFDLSNCEDVHIELEYLLVTGIYGAIDELKLVYKTTGEQSWQNLANMPGSNLWTSFEFSVPEELYKNNVVFGIYYDDFYKWGFGAGLDNFHIYGECTADTNIDVVPLDMREPITNCDLTDEEIVTVTLKNEGENDLPAGTIIELDLSVNNSEHYQENLHLSEPLFSDSTMDFTFSTRIDLSNDGIYNIGISILCSEDINPYNDTLFTEVLNYINPTPYINGLEAGYCMNEEPVPIIGVPVGGTFTGVGVVDSTLFFDAQEPGEITLNYMYSDNNDCVGDTTYVVNIFAVPETNILIEDTALCENSDSLIIPFEPDGGVFSGNGIRQNVFYPDADLAEINQIFYSYTSVEGCTGIDSIYIDLLPVPDVFLGSEIENICFNHEPLLFTLVPEGGSLSGTGITGNYFIPEDGVAGENIITYGYSDINGCSNSDTLSIFVNAFQEIDFVDPANEFCENTDQQIFSAIPGGGNFSGPGMIDSLFIPLLAGIGQHNIIYSLADNCNADTLQVEVFPSPDVDILLSDTTICRMSDALFIEAIPSGGILLGEGITDNYFNPTLAYEGENIIEYDFSDLNGCSGSDTLIIIVASQQNIIFDNTTTVFCANSNEYILSAIPQGGYFSGPGVDDTVFSPFMAGEGIHNIIYELADNCNADTLQLEVYPSPDVNIILPDTSVCKNSGPLFVEAIPDGGFFNYEEIANNYINPEDFDASELVVSYFFENEYHCLGTDSTVIVFHEVPEARILNEDNTFCQNQPPIEIYGIPSGGIFLGSELVDNMLIPGLLSEGEYTVLYQAQSQYGCLDTAEFDFSIFTAPELSLGNDTTITTEDTLIIYPATNGDFFYWYNNSNEPILELSGSELNSGENAISLIVENLSGCIAKDTLTVYVEGFEKLPGIGAGLQDIKVMPNPVKDYFQIQCSENVIPESIWLYSISGLPIYSFKIAHEGIYSVDFIPPGAYLLIVKVSNKFYTLKLIK